MEKTKRTVTAASAEASRENGRRYGGRKIHPLDPARCTCGRADGTHARRCAVYQKWRADQIRSTKADLLRIEEGEPQ